MRPIKTLIISTTLGAAFYAYQNNPTERDLLSHLANLRHKMTLLPTLIHSQKAGIIFANIIILHCQFFKRVITFYILAITHNFFSYRRFLALNFFKITLNICIILNCFSTPLDFLFAFF